MQFATEVDYGQYPEKKRPPHTKGIVIIHWLVIVLLALSVMLIAAFSMVHFFAAKDSRFRDYQHAMNVNGCDIYLNKTEIAWSKNEVSKAIAWVGKACSQSERVYISYFDTLPRISLISCNGDILSEKIDCSSYYIYREEVEQNEK